MANQNSLKDGRGILTPRVIEHCKSSEFFKEITVRELRLIPYIIYLVTNREALDPRRVNTEERVILARWARENWISAGPSKPVSVTREFWIDANDILWMSYATPDHSN